MDRDYALYVLAKDDENPELKDYDSEFERDYYEALEVLRKSNR